MGFGRNSLSYTTILYKGCMGHTMLPYTGNVFSYSLSTNHATLQKRDRITSMECTIYSNSSHVPRLPTARQTV